MCPVHSRPCSHRRRRASTSPRRRLRCASGHATTQRPNPPAMSASPHCPQKAGRPVTSGGPHRLPKAGRPAMSGGPHRLPKAGRPAMSGSPHRLPKAGRPAMGVRSATAQAILTRPAAASHRSVRSPPGHPPRMSRPARPPRPTPTRPTPRRRRGGPVRTGHRSGLGPRHRRPLRPPRSRPGASRCPHRGRHRLSNRPIRRRRRPRRGRSVVLVPRCLCGRSAVLARLRHPLR